MLAWDGHEPRPFMPVGRPAQALTNIWRLDTSHNSNELAATTRNADVMCVWQGREADGDIQMCQVWCSTLCWPKLFSRLSHKDQVRPLYKQWSLDHDVSKRTWIFTSFFKKQFFSITI